VAEIPGMGDAGRVYAGIYRRYGKYPVYTGIFGVLRPLYCLPAPRRATARRAGPSAAHTWRRSSHAPVGLLLFTGARDGGVGRRRRTRCPRARARGAARLRLAALKPDNVQAIMDTGASGCFARLDNKHVVQSSVKKLNKSINVKMGTSTCLAQHIGVSIPTFGLCHGNEWPLARRIDAAIGVKTSS